MAEYQKGKMFLVSREMLSVFMWTLKEVEGEHVYGGKIVGTQTLNRVETGPLSSVSVSTT